MTSVVGGRRLDDKTYDKTITYHSVSSVQLKAAQRTPYTKAVSYFEATNNRTHFCVHHNMNSHNLKDLSEMQH